MTIAGGQGMGQKNTILAIWLTQTYLNPIASLGPGMYVIWQNVVNSWQIWKKKRTEEINQTE
jgi:BASS family bile acid:Na+ symporter